MPVEFDDIWTLRYACPCGEGKYSVTWSGDIYGRGGFRCEFLCPKCSDEYIEHQHRWVTKRRLHKFEVAKNTSDEIRSQLIALLDRDYKEAWFQMFADKPKTQVYAALQAAGHYSHTLQTCRKNWNGYLVSALHNTACSLALLNTINDGGIGELATELADCERREKTRRLQMEAESLQIDYHFPNRS